MVTLKEENSLFRIYTASLLRGSRPELFCKKVFLKILQNSQKIACVGVSFLIKLQAWP